MSTRHKKNIRMLGRTTYELVDNVTAIEQKKTIQQAVWHIHTLMFYLGKIHQEPE